jgi:alcohol dehydrogenase/L-iditol 2-dehydrogenase
MVSRGDHVTLIGCGAEGLLLLQVLLARGARVTAADLRSDRLAVARELGADQLVRVGDDSAEGVCAPMVFEAAGAAAALELALRAATPGGRVIALGLGTAPAQLLPLEFVRRGLTLVGSLIYDHPADFQRAIQLVRAHDVRPSRLPTATVSGLDAVPSTLQALLEEGRPGKTLIRIGADAPHERGGR